MLGGSPLLFALTGTSLGVICTCRWSDRFPTEVLLLDNHTSQGERGGRRGTLEQKTEIEKGECLKWTGRIT